MGDLSAWPGSRSGRVGPLWLPSGTSDFHEILAANAGRASLVPDPLGSGASVFRVDCDNADVFPLTPTEDPRCQLLSPPLFTTGANYWIRGKLLIPTGFPAIAEGKFFNLFELYGAPAEGSPPVALYLGREGSEEYFYWQRNASYGFDIPWGFVPLVRGVWNEYELRVTHASQALGGRVEFWWNRIQQPLFKPATSYNPGKHAEVNQLVMSTQDASNSGGPNLFYIGQYRKHNTPGMEGTTTTYWTPPRIGLTKASVE